MKRTFIGIKIQPSKKLLEALDKYQRVLMKEVIKWVNPDNFHITLRYLGEIDEDEIEAIGEELQKLSGELKSTSFRIKGIGTFPNEWKPRVFFADIPDVLPLEKLYCSVENIVKKFGFEPENRPFHPHLTLARVKSLYRGDKFRSLLYKDKKHFFQDVPVTEIVFFESKSQSGGVIYEPLKKIKLMS